MQFSYKNYINRYNYQPYEWPPDLSLAQLHARCSEPGPENKDGVKCPCCDLWSKKKDLSENGSGTAIPGYFQLIKYYSIFALLVLFINSIYPIYATYYACNELDGKNDYCLEVGALFYLEFNDLIQLLERNNQQDMVDRLLMLQTAVFYVLLAANYFSIIFITFLNDSAKAQFQQLKTSQASRCLVFYNIPKDVSDNIKKLLQADGDESMNIIKSMELYQIKRYYDNFMKRNKIYYHLLSLYVVTENPLKVKNINKQLQECHHIVLEQKQKFKQFSGRIVVMFQNMESRRLVNQIYHMSFFQKWWYGVRTLLHDYGIKSFHHSQIKLSTYEIGLGSGIMWQNLGEQFGVKMAIRIKTFFVAMFFIGICYLVLYYPILFSMKAHIKAETKRFVKLTTFQKLLPNLTSIALVGLSTYFRIYMDRLSEQRNPKDQQQKARFVLITCLTFHLLFYVLIPTVFFLVPGQINGTVKLYVISEQARTFVVVQIIIILVDLPYRMWKNKKVKALSDQRIAFRNNQQMLNKLVECRDYPLEIRLQSLFRIWSLVLFYSFFMPYMIFYILVAFFVIFWIQKHNLYKHYTVRRKVSIRLESQTLIYYVNFFCIYICFIYCYTVQQHTLKILLAVSLTLVGLIFNITYWIFMNKGTLSRDSQVLMRNSQDLDMNAVLLKRQKLNEQAEQMVDSYHQFLQNIHNDQLDEQITLYLRKWKQYMGVREERRKSQLIEMQSFKNYGVEQLKEDQDQEDSQHENVDQSHQHF